MAYNSENHPLH